MEGMAGLSSSSVHILKQMALTCPYQWLANTHPSFPFYSCCCCCCCCMCIREREGNVGTSGGGLANQPFPAVARSECQALSVKKKPPPPLPPSQVLAPSLAGTCQTLDTENGVKEEREREKCLQLPQPVTMPTFYNIQCKQLTTIVRPPFRFSSICPRSLPTTLARLSLSLSLFQNILSIFLTFLQIDHQNDQDTTEEKKRILSFGQIKSSRERESCFRIQPA